MKHSVPKGAIILAHYKGFVRTEGGIRVTAVLSDGVLIEIDDLDTGLRYVDAPDTHVVSILKDDKGAQAVAIERRS